MKFEWNFPLKADRFLGEIEDHVLSPSLRVGGHWLQLSGIVWATKK